MDVIKKGVGGVDVFYAGNDLESVFQVRDQEFETIAGGLDEIEMDYDYIIIDTQAGLNEMNVRLMLYSDRNILLTNPEITALVDLYKVIKIVAQRKHGMNFEVVINKSISAESAANIFNKITHTVSQFHIKSSLSFLGYIVDDSKRVFESIQKRIPIVLLHERGNIRECFKMITNSFLRNMKPRRRLPFFYGLLGR